MKKAFLSFAILAMILFSCTKPEVGPIGPIGPAGTNGKDGIAGTNGTNGAAGTNGTNGTNGVNGNANVIGTATVALTSGSWTASSKAFYVILNVPAVTQAIVDKGVVLVYEQFGSSWVALPYTGGIASRYFMFALNYVTIFYQNTDGSQTTNPGNLTYRVVAISSSVAAANPNVNWGNYEEVMKILN
jgi:hypothetical protein